MKNWALAGLLLLASTGGYAQSVAPVILPSGCGTANFVNNSGYPTVDPQGRSCVSTSGGSGTTTSLIPPSTDAGAIAPGNSTAAESSHIFKASKGYVYAVSGTNQTATAGFFMLLDSATVPPDGAVVPKACAQIGANAPQGASYPTIPGNFQNGVVAVVSSGANCFTKTTGTITAHFSGTVQ